MNTAKSGPPASTAKSKPNVRWLVYIVVTIVVAILIERLNIVALIFFLVIAGLFAYYDWVSRGKKRTR